ncbi:MAG: AI-2E family transporter [Methanomicrobiaceae archaeon]|nr:AI-2E family transporter [Methanomicrobiaceae archaeon]
MISTGRLLIILIAGTLAGAAFMLRGLLVLIIVAVSIAVVVQPLFSRICARTKNRHVAALTTTLLVLMVLSVVVGFSAMVIWENRDYITEIGSEILLLLDESSGSLPLFPLSIPGLEGWARVQIGELAAFSGDMVLRTPWAVLQLTVIFLVLYCCLVWGRPVLKEVERLLPQRNRQIAERIVVPVKNTLYAIYVVHLSTALLTFLIAIPFFFFLGWGHEIFFALIAGIFQLFPMIGDSVLMAILLVYSLASGDLRSAVLIAAVGYPVVSALPDMYYRPLMMGSRTAIHPVYMWIGFFGGAIAMGTVGILIGPVIVALVVAAYGIFIEELEHAGGEARPQ